MLWLEVHGASTQIIISPFFSENRGIVVKHLDQERRHFPVYRPTRHQQSLIPSGVQSSWKDEGVHVSSEMVQVHHGVRKSVVVSRSQRFCLEDVAKDVHFLEDRRFDFRGFVPSVLGRRVLPPLAGADARPDLDATSQVFPQIWVDCGVRFQVDHLGLLSDINGFCYWYSRVGYVLLAVFVVH